MSTVTAILEPAADGTLHLPVPEALRHGRIEVVATLRPVESEASSTREGILDRLRQTVDLLGPIAPAEELPDVWLSQQGSKPDPLEP